jgi:hypothetical protein
MFELYDIFDNNEINIILLVIFAVILIIVVIGLAIYDYRMKQKLIKVETKLQDISDALDININNNYTSDISRSSKSQSDDSYKKKYEDLLKEKNVKDSHSMQYSPSEYATLLKYNPILPYSAFTMDIINNAYLDMNEQGMYEDKYFALSNYDNIYDSTRSNSKNTNNSNNANSDSGLTSDDLSIIQQSENKEMKNNDNPTTKNNSTNPTLPNSNKMNTKF